MLQQCEASSVKMHKDLTGEIWAMDLVLSFLAVSFLSSPRYFFYSFIV